MPACAWHRSELCSQLWTQVPTYQSSISWIVSTTLSQHPLVKPALTFLHAKDLKQSSVCNKEFAVKKSSQALLKCAGTIKRCTEVLIAHNTNILNKYSRFWSEPNVTFEALNSMFDHGWFANNGNSKLELMHWIFNGIRNSHAFIKFRYFTTITKFDFHKNQKKIIGCLHILPQYSHEICAGISTCVSNFFWWQRHWWRAEYAHIVYALIT